MGLKQNGKVNICRLDLLKIALTPHLPCVLVCNFDLSKFFQFLRHYNNGAKIFHRFYQIGVSLKIKLSGIFCIFLKKNRQNFSMRTTHVTIFMPNWQRFSFLTPKISLAHLLRLYKA